MTSTFDKVFSLGSDNLYVTRSSSLAGITINNVGEWDGTASGLSMVSNGVNALGLAILAGPGANDVYVSGTFTQAGGDTTVNHIAYFNGSNWDDLNGATIFDSNVSSLAYDSQNNLLYASSHLTSTEGDRVGVYNGTSWTGIAEGTINTYTRLTLDSSGNLYLGYGSTLKRRLYSNGSWETLSSSIGGTITDLKYNPVDNRVYIVLYINSGNGVKYYDVAGETIENILAIGDYPRAIAFDSSNNIFVARQSPSIYQATIVRLDGGSWTNVYNYQNTSGVLDMEIDANDNIYAFANAGGLTVGVSPYGVGDWENFTNSTALNYGGPVVSVDPMDFIVGDDVCLTSNNSQHGTVHRLHPLGASHAVAVNWDNGPVFSGGKITAYFGTTLSQIEHIV
jgi:hypothetical protein